MCLKLVVVGKSFCLIVQCSGTNIASYVTKSNSRLLLIGVSVGIFTQIRSDAVEKRKDHIRKRKELEEKARAEATKE